MKNELGDQVKLWNYYGERWIGKDIFEENQMTNGWRPYRSNIIEKRREKKIWNNGQIRNEKWAMSKWINRKLWMLNFIEFNWQQQQNTIRHYDLKLNWRKLITCSNFINRFFFCCFIFHFNLSHFMSLEHSETLRLRFTCEKKKIRMELRTKRKWKKMKQIIEINCNMKKNGKIWIDCTWKIRKISALTHWKLFVELTNSCSVE